MSISSRLHEQLRDAPFSYGEALSLILENKGKAISTLPTEDFVFPDNSVIRLTNNSIQLMEFLQE